MSGPMPSRSRDRLRLDRIHADRTSNVLNSLVAKVGELVRKFVANVLIDRPRKAYAAWLSHAFQARGNIDAITVNVAPFDDDVPEIDAGPKFKSPLFCTSTLCSAVACCTSTAHYTASTTLGNSTKIPSPVVLTMWP